LARAEEAYNITRRAFERGSLNLVDLLDAQRTLNQTRVAANQARLSYLSSLFQLQQAAGVDRLINIDQESAEMGMNMRNNILLIAVALALTPATAVAKSKGLESVPYAIKMKCDTLPQRFDDALASAKPGSDIAAAKNMAAQGASLCRGSHYEEGADTLDKAM